MPLPSEIQLVPLDFDTIRAELKRYLQNQSVLQDYNFEGSALSTLIDVLAYDAYYHGWYTNFAINEVFLHTAQIRNSVVAAARQLGYTPRSVSSSVAFVDVVVSGLQPTEGSVTLDRYTPISTTIQGNTYTFYTVDAYTLPTYGTSSITFPSVELYEGIKLQQSTVLTASDIANSGVTLVISDPNVDTQTITVSVKSSPTSLLTIEYPRATSAVTVGPSSNVYFLFERNDGKYEIQFGDGQLGKNLTVGQQVIIDYLVSRGTEGNGADTFVYNGNPLGAISGTTNITVTLSNPNVPSVGGAPRETIESIKKTAPEIYQAQGRIVTPADARAILLNEYNGIDSLSIWGGEDNDPPEYGKMFVALKPVNADKFGLLQKEVINNKILRPKSLPTLMYEFVDPDYVYIIINSEVRYSSAFTSLRPVQLSNIIRAAILEYASDELGRFGAFFRYSQLSKTIDDADPSIRSNITNIQIEKRFVANTSLGSYVLDFNNEIFNTAQLATQENSLVVVSSKITNQRFSHLSVDGAIKSNCYIENRGEILNIYRDEVEVNNGETAIVQRLIKPNVGHVTFNTGRVLISNFKPVRVTTSTFNEIKLRAIPAKGDLEPSRYQIIRIAEDTITLRILEDSVSQTRTLTGRPILPSNFTF